MTADLVEPHAVPRSFVNRLLVTVRDPETRRYRPVGFLSEDASGYTFAYLATELGREGFRPLPGLARAAESPATSETLFPVFAERVISSRRPDRQTSLEALGLPTDAAPFEVLNRSQGQRVGDTIELLPAPLVDSGGPVSFTFLAHGIRYLTDAERAHITTLHIGEALRLRPEPENPVNPRAQLVTDTKDMRLGWLTDPLIDVIAAIDDLALYVERANGPDVGFHFRLLVRLQGVRATTGRFFDGPEWATASPE